MGLTHEAFWDMSWGEYWRAYWGYWLRAERLWLHTRFLALTQAVSYMEKGKVPTLEQMRPTIHDEPYDAEEDEAMRVELSEEDIAFFNKIQEQFQKQ